MDLSINLNQTRLNVRVAVLTKIGDDYLFERDKNGFYFPIGGRIKINENSYDAAVREISEEININISGHKLISTIECFFVYDQQEFHELCFVYHIEISSIRDLPNQFHRIKINEIERIDIRPSVIKNIIKSKEQISHYILDEILPNKSMQRSRLQ